MTESNGKAHPGCVVRLVGEYDVARREEVAAQFRAVDGAPLRIDFSEVTYIDSTILHELAQLRLRDEHRPISLTGVNRQIKRIFDIVKFGELFEITD